MAQKQQAKHRELYDMKCRGAVLDVEDLVLVKQTAWKGRHKIQDRWESGEYQVVGQPTPSVPVYTVKRVAGGKTKVLHRNLLLPLQGRVRQTGGSVEEGITRSDEEEERGDVIPQVDRTFKGRPRVTTKPQASPTSVEPNACSFINPSPPESISGDESSNREDDLLNTDSLTSHTTASNSTSPDILSVEASSSILPSVTESKVSISMPYLEDSSQSDHASDRVFTETSTEQHSSQHVLDSPISKDSSNSSSPPEEHEPPGPPIPRRSARSAWRLPPVCFGKVITHSAIISELAKTPTFRQTMFVSCIPNIIL